MGRIMITIVLINRRSFVGQFLAYDAFMNIVLSGAKEVITKGMRKDLPPLPGISFEILPYILDLPGEDISVERKRGCRREKFER